MTRRKSLSRTPGSRASAGVVTDGSTPLNAVAIYQDLVTEHGFTAKYASVMRFVRGLRGVKQAEACGLILTEPGQEGQVDFGQRHEISKI